MVGGSGPGSARGHGGGGSVMRDQRSNDAIGVLVAIVLALGALAIQSAPSVRAADNATLTVTPDTIVVASGETTVTVTLTNDAVTALRATGLTSTTNGSGQYEVKLDPLGTEERVLPPGGVLAWRATIQPIDEPGPAVIWLRADFVHEPPEIDTSASPRPTAGPQVPGVATASLTLTADGLMASVEVQGGSGDLTDRRGRPLELLVTNEGSAPIQATVTPHTDDMVVIAPETSENQTIAPSATVAFPFQIIARESIVPGDRTLLFDVVLTSGGQGRQIVASHTVTLGVLGDAQINALLGIPVFFLVPGTLILIVWQLIGGFFGRLSNRNLPTLETKEFWVIAIGLSLLLAPLYRPLTGLLSRLGVMHGGERDYLVGYGTRDVLIVWSIAFVLPATVYAVGLVVKWVLRRHEIADGDTPLQVLNKLGKVKGSPARRQVTVADRTALLYEDRPRDEQYWIGPKIEYQWLGVDAVEEEKVRRQLQSDGDVTALRAALKEAVDKGHALVRFVANGPLTGPQRAKLSDLTFAGEELLVEGREG